MKYLWFLMVLLACASAELTAETVEDDLYYEARAPFSESRFELRAGGGYDFTNPYLHLFNLGVGAYWMWDRTLALGVEGSKFFSDKRLVTSTLEKELGEYGFEAQTLSPDWNLFGVLRLTPLTGMVNFFSSRMMMADISLLFKLGTSRYRQSSSGLLVGTGIEFQLGITPTWGLFASFLWEGEKPAAYPWQSRAGFRVGPSIHL